MEPNPFLLELEQRQIIRNLHASRHLPDLEIVQRLRKKRHDSELSYRKFFNHLHGVWGVCERLHRCALQPEGPVDKA